MVFPRRRPVTVLTLLAVACTGGSPSPTGSASPEVVQTVEPVAEPPPPADQPVIRFAEEPTSAAFVVDGRILGLRSEPISPSREVLGPLMGWLSPRAIPSHDGTLVLYNTWEENGNKGTPSIRLAGVTSGTDEEFVTGAFSAAWRRDGAIAYFQGTSSEYRPNERFVGHVMVRSGLTDEAARRSAEPARYIVLAWAGDTLLAYEEYEGEYLELLAFDGPGRERELAEGGNVNLIAVSPDGKRALVAGDMFLHLYEVSPWRELDSVSLHASYSGCWTGHTAAAPAGPGIAVFRIRGASLDVVRLLDLPFEGALDELQCPSPRQLVGWTYLGKFGAGPWAIVECDLGQLLCTQGPSHEAPISAVYNPSRPAV